MADIFISYAQADRSWVKMLADALTARRFTVWWDMKVLPGDEFGDMVTREIAACRCVVVVWSASSVDSDWVYGEADEARREKKLIPVLKDRIKPPTAFRRIHTADLTEWKGEWNGSEIEKLMESIRARVGETERVPLPIDLKPPVAKPPAPARPNDDFGNGPTPPPEVAVRDIPKVRGPRWWSYIGLVILFILVCVLMLAIFSNREDPMAAPPRMGQLDLSELARLRPAARHQPPGLRAGAAPFFELGG